MQPRRSRPTRSRGTAQLVGSLSRAQPFIAGNERIALIVASRCLRAEGLPGLSVEDIERDPAFADALIAATAEDCGPLARYLRDAIWDAALAWTEWLGPPPPADPARWTLEAEHRALEAARRQAPRIPTSELDELVAGGAGRLARAMTARIGVGLGPAERSAPGDPAQRLALAVAGARRGRRICPHEPMIAVRFAVDGGLGIEVSLVGGAAGHGVTGASAIHLAVAPRDAIGAGSAPGFLAIPGEPAEARAARFDGWLDRALGHLLDGGPLRL